MNATAFAQVMKNPGLLRNYSLSELQELALRYPYASSVYSMVALKAHLEGDSNYEHYLNQAAIRIPDRKKLYHLIHSDYDYAFEEALPLTGSPVAVEEDFETAAQEPVKTEVEERVVVPPVLEEQQVVETPVQEEPTAPVEVQEEQVPVQEELKEEAMPKEEPAPAQAEEVVSEQPSPEFDPEEELELEEQMESRKNELAFEQEFSTKEEVKQEEESITEEESQLELPGTDEVLEALNALKSFRPEQAVSKTEDIVEEIRREVAPKEKAPVSKEKDAHSFSEWLSLLKGGQPEEPVKEEPVQEAVQEEERVPIEPPPPIQVEDIELEELPQETEEEKEIEEIITAKQAKASLAHDDELVTETLAQIYELQRKFDKAIKAYQTLSLKYPDKRAYFAEKIAKLKNK